MIARQLFGCCPLCGSVETKLIKSADCSWHPAYKPELPATIDWLRCEKCEHVFTSGYFTDDALKIVFNTTHDVQKPGSHFEQMRPISARMVERVKAHADLGTWVDVGFGNGSLLFTAEEYGFEPIGLDLRQSSVDAIRALGVNAFCIDIVDLRPRRKASVVSMADVLEHMKYPKEGLRAAHKILCDGGILFASMPNYDCRAWRLLDSSNSNPYWGEIEHYHNFSRSRLEALMRETGFEPVSYSISERYRVCMEIIARRL